jgi:hypothetical protein
VLLGEAAVSDRSVRASDWRISGRAGAYRPKG